MKKDEFIGKVAEKAGITKKLSREVYEAMEEVIGESFLAEDKLMVFGVKFDVKEVEAKEGMLERPNGDILSWSKPTRKVPYAKILRSTREKYTR